MANQTKSVLKGYFETGDTPSQAQYADLIDSQLNLSETGVQTAAGTISSSILEVANHITASGNISASGNLYGAQIHGGKIFNEELTNGRVIFTVTADGRQGDDADLTFANETLTVTKIANIDTAHITASGNISSSIGTGSFGSLVVDGSSIDFTNLPTSDPGITGRLYNSSGTIKISL